MARVPYHWRVLSVVTLGSLMTGVNASTLNVALPVVVRHFEAGALAAHWVLLSFMLTNTVLLVLCGRLADVFGRRETYMLGYGVFTVASLLLGLAPGVGALIALRMVQAAGFAMILANATAIITHSFPPHLLSQGIGLYISTISVSQVLGPSVGGFLADAAGWRWVFWFNVPFGIAAICWGAVTLRKVPRGDREPVDVRGALLLLCWLGGLLLALSEAGALGWGSPLVLAGVLAFALGLPLFWWAQRRTAHPLIDLGLFADPGFSLANAAAFLHTLARFGIVLVAALFFQGVRGVDAATAGLAVLPVPIAMMVASPLAGTLARWVGPRTVAVAGPAMTAAGLATLLLTLDAGTPYPVVAAGLALMGAGSGVFLTGNTTAIMARVPRDRLGVVNGMRLTLQNVGNTLGVAMALSLIASAVDRADRPALFTGAAPEGTVAGYQRAMAVMLVMALLSMAAAVAGLVATRRAPS
ncbi:drug resistance transporter, EmrB/QacA subfamily [Thermomonospora echinospora]|uniref:Drug resistance transporter, EmrB/QacA subfamily n=1 Tax=Thermomonospora echinospora TaxID=1992 RepID=A0A1H5VN77_9ACTN|nr:MFS transporter [Thermomonospora echinospora]SEF88694.1 drug resistance transporter, EmrB/QacA subfamily [Thermomonospora echinospora]